MKYFNLPFIFFIMASLNVTAQNYNAQGDLALEEKDYQSARVWYSEGLVNCDRYSIRKLTDIWKEQPEMRTSMRLSMWKCYNCLTPLAEQQDREAMLLLSDYFKMGIGIEGDSIRAEYWLKEYVKSLGLPVNLPPPDTLKTDEAPVTAETKEKSLLSNRFYSFAAYTYSRFEPVGGTIGFYNKFGFYLSYRADLNKGKYVYTCNNAAVPEIGLENPPYRFASEKWKCRTVAGGVFIPILNRKMFVSLGGGYVSRQYFREIVSLSDEVFAKNGETSAWCYNTEASYKGWNVELGIMLKWKRLIFFGGINSTEFRDSDGFLSIGYSF
ncbi:MAG: hypothetical protein LBB73_03225 [Dysgonamonadaceae bacterium]|jgi:hypothetical protein|nr:hypothetical protein [Dysgonamonadaceae bacterium]